MFETLSDSSHTTDGQDSFTGSSSARAAMKKQQLKELNNELIKENSLLRSQFEEAVEITAQFQDLHQKNQQLASQIGVLQADREDLDHRLEISLATNKELSKRLNEEKRNHSQQNDTNINAMNNEIEKVKEQAKSQLDSVLEELEKVKSVHEKDVLQQKTIVGRIDRVLQSGERYFNTKLSTIDDLIGYFDKPQAVKPDNNSLLPNSNSGNSELEKRLKHLKSKLRAVSSDKAELENQLSKVSREVSELRCEYAGQISDLQNKLASASEEKKNAEIQGQTRSGNLEKQIEQLKQELQHARSSQSTSKPSYSQVPTVNNPVPNRDNTVLPKVTKKQSLPEDLEKITILSQQVDDLTDRINSQDKKIGEQNKRLTDSDTLNVQLKMQIEKMKAELSTLNSLKEETAREIETLRNALHTKQAAASEPIQMPRLAPNVIKYQRAIEEQKNKLVGLTQQNEKQKKQIDKQDREIASLTQKLDTSNQHIRTINDDYADYRSKVESKRPLTAEDFLPADSFRCPEFEAPLAACIQKIATNPSLQPVTKIQSCFKAIHAHLTNSLKEIQAALDDTTKENQFLSASFNKFIVDLSIALCDQPTTIEDFFKSNGGQKLLQNVADFRVKFDDMKHQSDRLQEIVQHLDQSFPTGIDDPVLQITEMKNQYHAQCEIAAAKTSKLKKLRRELRELAQSSDAYKSDLVQRNEDLTQRLAKNTNTLSQLEKANLSLKNENARIQNELLEATRELAAGEDGFKRREADMLNKMVSDHNNKVNDITSKFNTLQNTYSELVDEYNAQEERLQHLESQNEIQKRQLSGKEREISDIKQGFIHQQDQFEVRIETEKKQLTDTYKKAIAELTDQCAKHRADVEKMAKTVAENEKQMVVVRNECNILKKQKLKIENDMKSLLQKVDRERKLLETNFTAKRIAYETETSQKMNEERQKFEQEKRRICGFGAEAFKMFFNANSSIDEKSFRNVVENARDELTRLTKSDASVRRIVAARDNQTTEDAVAQVLMSSA